MPIPTLSVASVNIKSVIDIVQQDFFSKNGRYWQGKRTRTDDEVKVSDCTSWKEEGIDLSGLEEDIEVYVHHGPEGHGYTIYSIKPDKDGEWRKAEGFGAHSRTFDWTFTSNLIDGTPR